MPAPAHALDLAFDLDLSMSLRSALSFGGQSFPADHAVSESTTMTFYTAWSMNFGGLECPC